MPAEVVVTVPDPPPPPAGYAVTGYVVRPSDADRPAAIDVGHNALAEAVALWVEGGTEECRLEAVASRRTAVNTYTVKARYRRFGDRAGWSEWK